MAIETQVSQALKRKMTCITCPTGCQLEVERDAQGNLRITGHQCRRGEIYAQNEVLNPRRVLTTTVRIRHGSLPLLPVRTAEAIPKELLAKAMEVLAQIEVTAPVKPGEVGVANILDTGIDVIASRDMQRVEGAA